MMASGAFSMVAILLCLAASCGASGAQDLAEMGILDVTAAPFVADPTGEVDSTEALQRAIEYARSHCMVTFLPVGTYLVSDTLICEQGKLGRRERAADVGLLGMGFGIGPRALPNVMVGSRQGPERPKIVLAPNSPGFDDPEKRKYVVRFMRWNHENLDRLQPNGSFNQMFVGIDIVIGEGNPGAVGIRHRGAQGSGVQDCTIDATHGFSGIEGGCGSGGSHANVTVIGGQIGADLLEAQPAPTVTGFTLIGQTGTALRYRGYETLTAVGLRIETDATGPVIVTDPNRLARDLFGQLSVVDSSIEFRRPGANVAIEARTSLYMQNVFVRGAETVARHSDGARLAGDTEGWLRIAEYAHGIDPPNERLEYEYKAPVYVDGQRMESRTLPAQTERAEPPEGLQSRHMWSDPFPSWESPGAVSVKAPPYGATGDNETDDAEAIQRAIDEHDIVFLPRGKYRVSRTVKLRPETKLIGVHRVFSVLAALAAEGGDFSDPARPQPVVRTSDDAGAQTVVAFLGISAGTPGAYCLDWRAGRGSVFRAVEMWASYSTGGDEAAPVLSHPQAVIKGNGGGRWYNFHADHRGSPDPAYRHLLVEGTRQPLGFYQCNPEHSQGAANMELRDARDVRIYGLKGENPTPILVVRDSDNVSVFGYGGNAIPPAGEPLLLFERTPNFLVANLVDRPMGVRRDPTAWPALIERTADGETIATAPLDRPVLYRRETVR